MTINFDGRFVPDNTIAVVLQDNVDPIKAFYLIESLGGSIKRDWFNSHFYYCLPLTIGNQYGFIVKAESDFDAIWDGSDDPSGVHIFSKNINEIQKVTGHFGMGIITIQMPWHYRTPPGINLMTITPPNIPQHGIMHMTGVVETDNLRRDFTFNLKITEPGVRVSFKKGDPIGAFIPIPRYHADGYVLSNALDVFTKDEVLEELEIGKDFGKARAIDDISKPHQAGRLYFRGKDVWGNEFPDHQKK